MILRYIHTLKKNWMYVVACYGSTTSTILFWNVYLWGFQCSSIIHALSITVYISAFYSNTFKKGNLDHPWLHPCPHIIIISVYKSLSQNRQGSFIKRSPYLSQTGDKRTWLIKAVQSSSLFHKFVGIMEGLN